MMILLLLLGAFVCTGFSYYEDTYECDYGETFSILLLRNAQSIEFKPKHNSNVTILWRHDNPQAIEDRRHTVIGAYYAIFNVTQKDSGRYIMRDKDQKILSTKIFEVVANTKAYSRNPGGSLHFIFHLEPNSCNIYFFPESDHEMGGTEIVRQGRLKEGLDERDCTFFHLLKPCGILNDDLKMSCSGRFEVRDQNGNNALVVLLEMEPLRNDSFAFGIGVGVILAALSCCACVRCCCCGKRSSKKDRSETANAEPAMPSPEVNRFCSQDYLSQPSGTRYSAQPSFTPTGPLIHNPPTVKMPPAYSELHPAAHSSLRTHTVDNLITVSPLAEQPRFELKGMTSASPLSSDSTYCDTYNSDKLNFL
ncbi:uncharacterized protein LOC119888634 isoform X1 [Micropterus salmoides]|uniref:uncharacterized protein LOC119888634 isoform X1 n=1 Tax=Micropterus salmoides TaxID=27706 RepID=UPI0018EB2D30|nr:uncharacterized protein LOC119888634 isoform X1 [Micropterus salmoides]